MILRPSATIASLIVALAWSPLVLANPSIPPRTGITEAMTEESRKLFQSGVQAASESRWEAARALFLAARALHPHYTIDGNLGDCELHLGRYREAAEYLARYVRELKKDSTSTAEERAQGEAAYAEARAKVGALVVRANVDGARVFVDGGFRGVTPLPDPLFVEPGVHTTTIEHEEYETEKMTSKLGAGGSIEHGPKMRRKTTWTPSPPGKPETRGAPPGKPLESDAALPAARSWVPVIALGAASAVGLGLGVGFTVASNNASADAETQRAAILRDKPGCLHATGAFAERCEDIGRLGSRTEDFGNGAIVAYAASGAFALSALAIAVWPRSHARATGVRASTSLQAGGASISIEATW